MSKLLSFSLGFILCGILCVGTATYPRASANQGKNPRLEGALVVARDVPGGVQVPPNNDTVQVLQDIKAELVELNKEVKLQGKEQRNISDLIRNLVNPH